MCSAPFPKELTSQMQSPGMPHMFSLVGYGLANQLEWQVLRGGRKGHANTAKHSHREWGLEQPSQRAWDAWGAPDKGKLAPGSYFLAEGWMKCYKRQKVNVSQWHTSLCVIRNEIMGNPRTVLTQCGDSCAEQRWLFYVFSHWEALLLNVRFLIKRKSVLFYWQPQWMKPPRGK